MQTLASRVVWDCSIARVFFFFKLNAWNETKYVTKKKRIILSRFLSLHLTSYLFFLPPPVYILKSEKVLGSFNLDSNYFFLKQNPLSTTVIIYLFIA
jgi:hypothetical protein